MPRPRVSVETLDDINEFIDSRTAVPTNALDFQEKVQFLLSTVEKVGTPGDRAAEAFAEMEPEEQVEYLLEPNPHVRDSRTNH